MKKICLENELIKAVILPEYGGKIASFVYKKNRFDVVAQNTRGNYLKSDKNTLFEDRDASGIDDGFPSLISENVNVNGQEHQYTDHGEIWRSEFVIMEQKEDCVSLFYKSSENPFNYFKKIKLKNNRLVLDYTIENTGTEDYPCLWVFHGLMIYRENMKLLYPAETTYFRNAMNDPILGKEGTIYAVDNEIYDFTKVPVMESKDTKKYFVEGKVKEGYCGFLYPDEKMVCEVLFDKKKLPFLGVWITSGGYRGDYNCAFEPATGFYDSISSCKKSDTVLFIKKNEPFSFGLELVLKIFDS